MRRRDRQRVRFYEPHPGFSKTLAPLPEAMRKIAKSLDNKVMTLSEAVKKISPAAEKVGGTIEVLYRGEVILFELKKGDDTIGYRLIRYKRV